MKSFIGFIVIVLGLGGCATDYSKKTPAEIASQITVSDSEFNSSKVFFGPPIQGSPELFLKYTTRLGATVDKKTGAMFYTITTIWEYQSNSWMFFSAADLPGAIRLQSSTPTREVSMCGSMICTYVEMMNSIVPLQELSKNTESFRVSYSSKLGPRIVEIPRNYVDGYLQGMRRVSAH